MGKKYVADVFETTGGKNLDTGKVDVSNNNTGSVIDLGNQSVNYYNMDESDDHSFIIEVCSLLEPPKSNRTR